MTITMKFGALSAFAKLLVAPILSAVLLVSCTPTPAPPPETDVATRQVPSGFPYHPLIYHLDLSILAYQLYGQSLVWPFDPYYESFGGRRGNRRAAMEKVRLWARSDGPSQAGTRPALGGYRGPGALAGFADNPRHDPILYRYDRLDPWSHAITGSDGRWTEYRTPNIITRRIGTAHVCYRKTGGSEGDVVMQRFASRGGGRDALFVFEGATGDKGEAGQPPSQSLLGFVLLRRLPKGPGYDVHIAFRGSRSGSLPRAVQQAFSTRQAAGNPDWITDLGFDLVSSAGRITTTGRVHRGFARSLDATMPRILACLAGAARLSGGQNPRNIYVTGHSLGGGLAQHFASAVLLGNRYRADSAQTVMPQILRSWPWRQIKLITYSAPRAGDPLWARTLTENGLASDFHTDDSRRYDFDALAPGAPSIAARLTDPSTPAGFRVLATTDPISTSLLPGRKPVGKTVYADGLGPLALVTPHNPASHEPGIVRDLLVAGIREPGVPANAWAYLALVRAPGSEASPETEGYVRLKSDLEAYFRTRHVRYDREIFASDFDLLQKILSQ